MKRKSLCIFLVAILALLVSCSNEKTSRTVYTMDTIANITLMPGNDELADKIENLLNEIDEELSPTDGKLYELNSSGGGAMGNHLEKVMELSERYSDATGGRFSPYLGSIIELWGIGEKDYVPTEEEISSALLTAKKENVTIAEDAISLQNGAKLNFGAIAKGYATDEIRNILRYERGQGAVVELGGNVYVHGTKASGEPFQVAIRDPQGDANDWVLALPLSDMFVISSGDYERYFEKDGKKYHHILNPETGSPAESDLAAVCVISENGAMGDAYSTALYVMGKEAALSFWRENIGFELVLIGRDNVVTLTEGIAGISVPNEKKEYVYEVAER